MAPFRVLVLSVLAAAAAAATAVVRVLELDQRSAQQSDGLRILDAPSPGPSSLALLSLEHPLAAADLTWLGVVQDLGRAKTITGSAWSRVEHGGHIATDLDPRYFTVYHATAVNLAVYAQEIPAAEALLLKGRENLPDRWEFPMLLGYIAYFMRGDAKLASDYTQEASRYPEAPRFLAPLAGRMLFQAGDERGAITLLELMAATLEGPAREEVESRLIALRSEPRLSAYDRACKHYRAKTGRLPADGKTLYREGWVSEEPQDDFGEEITLDAACVSRTVMVPVREFEARRRIGSLTATTTSTRAPTAPR